MLRRSIFLLLLSVVLGPSAQANTAPLARHDGPFSIHNNGSLLLDVMANDEDADGDTLVLLGPIPDPNHPPDDHAAVTVEGNQIRYVPNEDFVGTDIFRYRIYDGETFDAALVTVEVSANRRPNGFADPGSGPPIITEPETPILIDVLANDSEPDGDPLYLIFPVLDPVHPHDDHATITIEGNQLLYVPHPDFEGTDTFRYRVTDGALYRAPLVTVEVVGNRRPIAVADPDPGGTITTDWETSILIDVLANDFDLDGDTIYLAGPIEDLPDHPVGDHATVLKEGDQIRYIPNTGFEGTDTFRYRINDGTLMANSALVTVQVTDPNGSLPPCTGPGDSLLNLSNLLHGDAAFCNGGSDYKKHFPNAYTGSSFNGPVASAAWTLYIEPSREGPDGPNSDVVDWWIKYLQGELGLRSGWHYGATETFSGAYQTYNIIAVAFVHYHAQAVFDADGAETRYRDVAALAKRWLRATFAVMAAASVPTPDEILDDNEVYLIEDHTPGTSVADDAVDSYVALAGQRYRIERWIRQLRSMIYARAVLQPSTFASQSGYRGETNYQRDLLIYIEDRWPGVSSGSSSVYGLTPAEATSLAGIQGRPNPRPEDPPRNRLPQDFENFFLAAPGQTPTFDTSVKVEIVGFDDGSRVTILNGMNNTNKAPTFGKVYYGSDHPSARRGKLVVLYPYEDGEHSFPPHGDGFGRIDLDDRRAWAESGQASNSPPIRTDSVNDLHPRSRATFRITVDTHCSGQGPCPRVERSLGSGSGGSGSNGCPSPDDDQLLGHWDFEVSSHLGLDSSVVGRHATALGSVWQVSGRDGKEKALQLSGTSLLQAPSLGEDLNLESELTVAAWLKVPLHVQFNAFRLRQPVGLYSDQFTIANSNEGAGWYTVTANPSPPVGSWYHLTGVFDHGSLRIYVNGVLAGSKTLPVTRTAGASYATWTLGGRLVGTNPDQHFIGEMDDLQVYRRALSEEEIGYAAGVCP